MTLLEGHILNVITGEVYPGKLEFTGEMIEQVERTGEALTLTKTNLAKIPGPFILPGLIDAHIHIESSMLTPSRFGQVVVSHGTTSVISDPHEIGNVMGTEGLKFMIADGRNSPINIYYTVPSCVPATEYENSGSVISLNEVSELLRSDDFIALGEMMNYPGVLSGDPEVMGKIKAAQKVGKPVDGHAPLLSGKDLCKYISAGITTDHECTNISEAVEKARKGMKIQVRQGSAAKNLKDLLEMYKYPGVMTVSDDRHPQDLLEGHMDVHLRSLLENKVPFLEALRSMTINPCEHYGIRAGALIPGRLADIIMVEDMTKFKIIQAYVRGKKVYDGGGLPPVEPIKLDHRPKVRKVTAEDLMIKVDEEGSIYKVRVIGVTDGQITTVKTEGTLRSKDGFLVPNIEEDILPIVVINRYGGNTIGKGFVHGFGIKNGALCSTIAHDSHNIICVGSDYEFMERVIKRELFQLV